MDNITGNQWRSPDPKTLSHLSTRDLILLWIGEYDRLSRLLIEAPEAVPGAWPGSPGAAQNRDLRREIRNERDMAAARVVGLTKHVL